MEYKGIKIRQNKHETKYIIGMTCLAMKEQARLAIKMLVKINQYDAN